MPLLYSIDGVLSPFDYPVFPPVFGVDKITPSKSESERRGLPPEVPSDPELTRVDAILNYQKKPSIERSPVCLAGQIMSAPAHSILLTDTLEKAKLLMKKMRFRHVPVVTEDGSLKGIISDRDLLGTHFDFSHPVTSIMSTQVLTATRDTKIRQIAEVMLNQRIGALPILDRGNRLVGILTTSDILRAIVTASPINLFG